MSDKIIQNAHSVEITYKVSLDDMKTMIARDLGVDRELVRVEYVIEEVGGDYFDRHPGTKQVTRVRVVVSPKKSP